MLTCHVSLISFGEETLDLPGHVSQEPPLAPRLVVLAGAGLAAGHAGVDRLGHLDVHLLVRLVRPQPLALDGDQPLLRPRLVPLPPLSLWCSVSVDADLW